MCFKYKPRLYLLQNISVYEIYLNNINKEWKMYFIDFIDSLFYLSTYLDEIYIVWI